MKKFFLALMALFLINNAHAYEVKNVCASTQSGFQWTRSQPIQIQIIGGMELQQASGFNPNIKGWVSYAFIDWTNGRNTVIELTSPYVAGMMMFQTEGVDSTGRKWRFSDNMGYCV